MILAAPSTGGVERGLGSTGVVACGHGTDDGRLPVAVRVRWVAAGGGGVCQAIPRPVLRVEGDRIEVDVDGRSQWVIAPGLPQLTAGDYVIVHAGAALERLPRHEAEAILAFYANLDDLLAESATADRGLRPGPADD